MWPPIAWLALAYGAGVGAGLAPAWTWPAAAVAVAGGVALRRSAPWAATAALFLVVGWATGGWARAREGASCAARWGEGQRAATLVLLDRVAHAGDIATAVVRDETCSGTVRVRWEAPLAAPGGARVAAVGTWRSVFTVRHARVLDRRASWRGHLRGAAEARLERLFGQRQDLATALVLARAGAVPRETRERFVRAGLAHVLAISGLHVGFVAWWLAWAARQLGASAGAGGIFAAAGALGYAWLLGFPAPATRAAWFVALAAAARARERRPAPWAVLAVAALGVLAVDPQAIRSVGAWLSVSAVAGIIWARRQLRRPRLVADSLGATLFTAPLTALVFGTVAPVGVATNLVAVPLVALAVPGILLALLAEPLFPGVAALLASGAGTALSLTDATAWVAGRLPLGHIVAPAGAATALPWLLLLTALISARWRRPTLWVSARRVALPAAVAAWAWVGLGVIRRDEGPIVAIHFLSVGQGDAIAIRTPRDRWILIDGGPRDSWGDAGRRVVVPFLRRWGVERLEAVVLSHGHADHAAGLVPVLEALAPAHVWEPGQPVPERVYLEFLGAVEASGARWHPARRGDRLEVDSVVLLVHHPDSAWLATSLDLNENSLVVEVGYRQFRALFPGDAGAVMEWSQGTALGPVTLLKVGHHGSASATTGAWLDRLRPQVAVISVGARNRYGHPAPEVLGRLAGRGVAVYRTDQDGPVVVRTDGFTFSVSAGHEHAWYVRHDDRAVHHGAGAPPSRGHR